MRPSNLKGIKDWMADEIGNLAFHLKHREPSRRRILPPLRLIPIANI